MDTEKIFITVLQSKMEIAYKLGEKGIAFDKAKKEWKIRSTDMKITESQVLEDERRLAKLASYGFTDGTYRTS